MLDRKRADQAHHRRIDRHGGGGVPRHAGTPRRQARHREVLPGPRPRARHRGVRLPPRRRRGHGTTPRLPVRQLGDRVRRRRGTARPRHVAAPPLARGLGHGGLRRGRHRRGARSRCRRDGSSGDRSNGPEQLGLDIRCATELEFYLFRETFEEASAQGWRDLHPHVSTIEDYQLLQTSREEYVLRRIRNEMVAAGIPVEFSKGEAGRGQHEVNVTYGRAIEVADRHLVFKNGVKEIADQCGRSASFMAKWSMGEVGSSCHIHASIWDAASGAPLMWGDDGPSNLSEVGRQFLAGLLARCPPAHLALGAVRQLVQALRPGIVGTDRRGVGRRQPYLWLPPRRARRRPPGRVPDPRCRRQPLPGAGGHLGGGPVGRRARPRAAARPSRATPTTPPTCPACRRPWSKPSRSSRRRPSPDTHSARTSITTFSTPPARNGPEPTRWSPTGS